MIEGKDIFSQYYHQGTSLVVQWLRLHTSNAEDMGSIPSQGTKVSHVVWCGQKNKNKNKLSPVRVQFSMPSLSVSAVS